MSLLNVHAAASTSFVASLGVAGVPVFYSSFHEMPPSTVRTSKPATGPAAANSLTPVAAQCGQGSAVKSRLTASLAQQSVRQQAAPLPPLAELHAILQNTNNDTCFLGVSPPPRSGCFGGACNPLGQDRHWAQAAHSASRVTVSMLREMHPEAVSSFINSQLVLGSPVTFSGPSEGGSWMERMHAHCNSGSLNNGHHPQLEQPIAPFAAGTPCRQQQGFYMPNQHSQPHGV